MGTSVSPPIDRIYPAVDPGIFHCYPKLSYLRRTNRTSSDFDHDYFLYRSFHSSQCGIFNRCRSYKQKLQSCLRSPGIGGSSLQLNDHLHAPNEGLTLLCVAV